MLRTELEAADLGHGAVRMGRGGGGRDGKRMEEAA
jgi:hypothetical protein